MNKLYKTLEFDNILGKVAEYALSGVAQNRIFNLTPSLDEKICKKQMQETTQAQNILDIAGNPPLSAMENLQSLLDMARAGVMLTPYQLSTVGDFINNCTRMAKYLENVQHLESSLAYSGMAFIDMTHIQKDIESSISCGKVQDSASPKLADIRRKVDRNLANVKNKLDTLLKNKREYLSDSHIVTRNDRYVLPVRRECKSQIAGTVVETSSKGATIFIEPSAIAKLQADISLLRIEEEMEISIILYTLSGLIADNIESLYTNMKQMEYLDFVFAKAKYSYSIKGIEVPVLIDSSLKIVNGRHPLLPSNECVPLHFEIGKDYKGVVITGPNTGGKTVALKTIGLLSLMAQCGLHVPVDPGSTFAMKANILCDIGDGQSISANLSTFSAHITNIINILEHISGESLVLLDELGSGTDPTEGMGIAVAILEELRRYGCTFVATTHYPEVKDYAKKTDGLVNARMEFDRENLKPLYKLQLGEAGESCALEIAKRLGLPAHMVDIANSAAYKTNYVGSHTNKVVRKPSKLRKSIVTTARVEHFSMGDSVNVLPNLGIGIVYKPANDKGDYIVQIKGKKETFNHTRLKLKNTASELYPDDYDFSIIFDSVANRKARHKMNTGHRPDMVIRYDD